jgi:hypothetical protein
MDQERVIIRARGLGGLWVPLGLGFTLAWGALMAFLLKIAANPFTFRLWLIVIVICLASTFGFELIVRRSFVEVTGGRIRYFFREKGERGDRPVTDVRSAYAIGGDGLVVFNDGGGTMIGGDLFKRQDIERLVGRIHALNPGASAAAP